MCTIISALIFVAVIAQVLHASLLGFISPIRNYIISISSAFIVVSYKRTSCFQFSALRYTLECFRFALLSSGIIFTLSIFSSYSSCLHTVSRMVSVISSFNICVTIASNRTCQNLNSLHN